MMIHIPEAFSIWITNYGSFALFFLVLLGLLAIPVPQNLLLMFAGVLIAQHKLSWVPVMLAVYLAALGAITLTYLIGKSAGYFLLHKYGRYIGATESRLEKVNRWYERIGKWTLFFGYFFPVVRRLMGYAAGLANLHFRVFLIFTGLGALVWTVTFVTIGYMIGMNFFH